MTEQEAQAVAARLTRIWQPLEAQMPVFTPGEWLFYADLQPDVSLQVNSRGELFLNFTSEMAVEWELGHLHASNHGLITFFPVYEYNEMFKQRAEEWMPIFRRGCWLSGCPIEASAHEKAEWIQGFTQQELEAWNLKV